MQITDFQAMHGLIPNGRRFALESLEPRRVLSAGVLLISELLAVNDLGITDSDGEFSDWIEIYNPADTSASLDRWYLTDNHARLTKWQVPNVSLMPGEYLVVFASGKDRTDPAELHTNFKLDGDGEYLALVRPDGTTVAHEYTPEFPQQHADVSYGISPEGGSARYFDPPTPGEPNGTGLPGFVADTRFSVDRGFFEEPLLVEITSETAGAAIYYTLDGSVPSETKGVRYTGPITIDTTTTLRASATKEGYAPTNVDTQTYIFPQDVIRQPIDPPGFPPTWGDGAAADYEMDPDIVDDPLYSGLILDALRTHPTISLVMDPPDLWDPATGIYANSTEEGPLWERDVSIELIDFPEGEDLQVDAGIRIHGSTSRQSSRPKHNFRLIFRKQYGLGKLEYPLFGDTQVQRFNDLVLRAGDGDSWFHPGPQRRLQAQYTHDQWHKDTQLAMGQPASQQGDTHLYVNGLYWGFYHLIERPDASFMEEHFGGRFEDYDVLQHRDGTVNGNRDAWDEMMDLLDAGDVLPGEGATDLAYQDVLEYIDPVNLADWMLLNFYSANNDWDHNNWYGGRKREPGQTWKFFSWDAEETFRDVDADVTGVNKDNQPSEVHQQLSVNPEYRMLFADRAHKHLFNDGVLTPEVVADDWLARAAEIELALVAESARWADHHRPEDPYTVEDEFRVRQNELRADWFPRRTGILVRQLRNRGMYPSVDAPVFYVNGTYRHGGRIDPADELTMPADSGTVYYTLDGSDPRLPGGGVSDEALIFDDDPLSLDRSAVVKSRKLAAGRWSALNEALFVVHRPASAENLVVTELNYNPYDPTPDELAVDPLLTNEDFEFIELGNTSDDAISLSGAKFDLGIRFDFTPAGGVDALFPGQHVVVAANSAAWLLRYPGEVNLAGQYSGKLRNEGESIRLLAAPFSGWRAEPIFHFGYDNTGGWPGRAGGKGASLELIDPAGVPNTEPERTAFLKDDANWRSSSEYGGSPGSPGNGPIGDVVVNEVLSHSSDAIELYNTTGQPIDIAGWYLSDSWGWESNPANGDYKKFRIPDDTHVPPLGYLVLDEDDFNAIPGSAFALSGDRSGDIWLMEADASGELIRFVDHVKFGAAAEGESWGRWPNGEGDLYPMAKPTLDQRHPENGQNAGPRVGPLIFSEIHYHPASGEKREERAAKRDEGGDSGLPAAGSRLSTLDSTDLEYVEIYNFTGTAVDLAGWRIRGGIDFDFPADTLLAAYSPLVVVPFEPSDTDKLTAFRIRYEIDDSVELAGGYSRQLNDQGERIQLLRPQLQPEGEPPETAYLLEDEVRYSNREPWPTDAGGQGHSLHRAEADLWGNTHLSWLAESPSPGTTAFAAKVVGRYVFYNNSTYDGNDPAPGTQDDAAIAPDKSALLPGATATFANYTSYIGGLGGLMIDVADMPELALPDADDFQFRIGNDDDPDHWAPADPPSVITVRPGQGIRGSDRVTIIWTDALPGRGAVRNRWLQVTVLPTAATGLTEQDVFYFGNAIGETGNSTVLPGIGYAKVNAIDMLGARDNQRHFLNPAPIDFAYDFNRDRRVTAVDMLIARENRTHFLNALRLISVPQPATTAGLETSGTAGRPERDAVFDLVAGHGRRETSPKEPTWLSEFEPTGPNRRDSARRSSAGEIVDTRWTLEQL